jgi:hypothetical protein
VVFFLIHQGEHLKNLHLKNNNNKFHYKIKVNMTQKLKILQELQK